MIKSIKYLLFFTLAAGCKSKNELQQSGLHYQQYQDYKSLENVVKLLPVDADTLAVKNILGTPNDMGFEYRYTVDSTGVNGCTIGAVFQINDQGKIIQKWIDEICE
ncbi:MAG: hypothetical protein ACOYLO_12440 [Ferruginibacter sp.]